MCKTNTIMRTKLISRKMLVFVLCILLLSCTGRRTQVTQSSQSDDITMPGKDKKNDNSLLFLDITKEYPKRDFNIQDIANIEYIPIETTNDVLLDGGALSNLAVSDNLIVTCNMSAGTVFVFDRTGKVRNSFNHQGSGGNEYQSIIRYCVDFNSNEIFIWDFYPRYRIMVYSLNGEFKRVLKLKSKLWPELMFNYNDDFLFCYDAYKLDYDNREGRGRLNDRPYSLISKKNAQIYPLNLEVQNRMSNNFNSSKQVSYMVNIYSAIKKTDEIIISDFALDTIYSFKDNVLQLIAVHNTTPKSDATVSLVSVLIKTNKYIFWDIIEKKIVDDALVPERRVLVQDCLTGEVWEPLFYSTDFLPKQRINIPDVYMTDLPENYARRSFTAEMLTDLYQKDELTGKLKDAASKLKEDDNPVLMLIKFK